MQYLLDTHTVIWFFESDPGLSQTVKNIIEDRQSQLMISVASIWEMSIKISLNKLEVSKPLTTIVKHFQHNGIEILPIVPSHALEVQKLPFHHKDPFDRMIIAQSKLMKIPVISKDGIFDRYITNRIW